MRLLLWLILACLLAACRLSLATPAAPPASAEPLVTATAPVVVLPSATFTLPPTSAAVLATATLHPTRAVTCVPRADWMQSYTIQAGDTLNRIAQRAGTTAAVLAQGNCLADANLINAGQTLRVPVLLPPAATPTPMHALCQGILNVTTSAYPLPAVGDMARAIQLAASDQFTIIGQQPGWYQLAIPNTGNYWVEAARLTLQGNCSAVPVVQPGTGLDANKCYFMSYGLGGPYPAYLTGDSDDRATTDAILQDGTYYEVVGINAVRYQIRFGAGGTRWADRLYGSLTGYCSAIMQSQMGTRTLVFDYVRLAFDYPASWYYGLNLDGLPGGYVGTFQTQDMPPTAFGWGSDMALLSFIVYPGGLASGLEALARSERDGFLGGGRYALVQDVLPITLPSGITGFMFEVRGPQGIGKNYYLNIHNQQVVFMLAGNYALTEPILNTLRTQ